jgi:hypothetical protein
MTVATNTVVSVNRGNLFALLVGFFKCFLTACSLLIVVLTERV